MATWIAHLRVAENILNRRGGLEVIPFLVGSIGPDSGVPNEDWSSFNPPKSITHWQGADNKIDARGFYDRYLSVDAVKKDKDRYSFYVGYYVHLLTDIEWSGLLGQKMKDELHAKGFEKDPNFIWTIKEDWYGLDFLYLHKHPECIFFSVFKNINIFPDYLDYYPPGAFTRQVRYITGYYLGENTCTKDNFIYLTENEMNNFVQNTTDKMLEILDID